MKLTKFVVQAVLSSFLVPAASGGETCLMGNCIQSYEGPVPQQARASEQEPAPVIKDQYGNIIESPYISGDNAAKTAETGAAKSVENRAKGSLIGSTQNWEQNQTLCWGGGIPGLTSYECQNGCGVIAADGLLRYRQGDNGPNLREIMNIAENKGYWNGGMNGPWMGGEQGLLRDLGIDVELYSLGYAAADQRIRWSLEAGSPVIISTSRHYYLASGTCSNGTLHVGHTGEVMRGGSACMSVSQIANLGGGSLVLLVPQN